MDIFSVLITVLIYSFILTVVFFIEDDMPDSNIVIFACGPVFWIIHFSIIFITNIKNKNYIITEADYRRYKNVEWPMYRIGNLILIRNTKNTKISYWTLCYVKKY